MRSFVLALAAVWILLAATSSSAIVSFDVIGTSVSTGHPLDALEYGDEITLYIRTSNPTETEIYGLTGGIQGWDESVATFVSGALNGGPYLCTDPECLDGLPNYESDRHPTNGSVEVIGAFGGYPAVGNYVSLVQAISLTGQAGDGSRDPGLDGIVGGGGAQFRVTFRMVGAPGAQTILNIGTNPNPIVGNVIVLAGGAIELANNANVALTMIPEAGTAHLLGLGLVGLAAARRRNSARTAVGLREP